MAVFDIHHPPRDSNRVNSTTIEIDGVKRFCWSGYAIKHYDLPDDPAELARRTVTIMRERLKSFFRHAEGSISPPAGVNLDQYIETLEKEYRDAPEEQKSMRAAFIVGAKFTRAVETLIKGMQEDSAEHWMEPNSDTDIKKAAESDISESLKLLKFVRRKGVSKKADEVDGVLAGMWGEFIQPSALSETQYFQHSYMRLAQTMEAMDRVAEKISVIKDKLKNKEVIDNEIMAKAESLIGRLAEVAKVRAETMRYDQGEEAKNIPSFRDVHAAFAVAVRNLHDFREGLEEKYPEEDRDPKLKAVLNQIKWAGKLITSMAKIRAPEDNKYINEYHRRCDDIIEGKFAARTGRSGGGGRTTGRNPGWSVG